MTNEQLIEILPCRVMIWPVDHSAQQYDTCGDWYRSNQTLHINVSRLPDRREMFLVAIHELVEAFLCECVGITEQQVDEFDLKFERKKSCGDSGLNSNPCEEPGDDSQAPYYHQHQIATGIERILAAEVGVDWPTYEKHINELTQETPYDY
jgi:hypothetical protein